MPPIQIQQKKKRLDDGRDLNELKQLEKDRYKQHNKKKGGKKSFAQLDTDKHLTDGKNKTKRSVFFLFLLPG
jgi:hypothetical protein